MSRKLVPLLECRVTLGDSFADYVSEFVSFDSLNLFVTSHFCAKYIPPLIDVFEVATVATELQDVLMFEASRGYGKNGLPDK